MKPGDFVREKIRTTDDHDGREVGVVLRVGGRFDRRSLKQVIVLWGTDPEFGALIEWDFERDLIVTDSVPTFLFFKNGNPMF